LTICTRRPLRSESSCVTTPGTLRDVDRYRFHRLVHLAADQTRHDLRLAHGELETLSAQHLDEYRELQLTRPCTSQVSVAPWSKGESNVPDKFRVEAVLEKPRGDLGPFGPDSGEVLMRWSCETRSSTMRTGAAADRRIRERLAMVTSTTGHRDDLARPASAASTRPDPRTRTARQP